MMKLTSDCGTDDGRTFQKPNAAFMHAESEEYSLLGDYTGREGRVAGNAHYMQPSALTFDRNRMNPFTGFGKTDYRFSNFSSDTGGLQRQEHGEEYDPDFSFERYELRSLRDVET